MGLIVTISVFSVMVWLFISKRNQFSYKTARSEAKRASRQYKKAEKKIKKG